VRARIAATVPERRLPPRNVGDKLRESDSSSWFCCARAYPWVPHLRFCQSITGDRRPRRLRNLLTASSGPRSPKAAKPARQSTIASSVGLRSHASSTRAPVQSNNPAERELRAVALGRKNRTFGGSDEGGRRAAAIYTLIQTALCRARHKQVYADLRTMPSGSEGNPSFARTCGPSSGYRPSSIRHSLACYSASRKASRRSLGRKRIGLPRSYGVSFARAASLSARWACR